LSLIDALKEALPFSVFPEKPLLQLLQEQGETIKPNQELLVDSIFYAGDAGGITFSLLPNEKTKQVYSVSLTHLKMPPEHPLAERVKTYKRDRVKKLRLQDRGGFASELLTKRTKSASKKRTKGFG
jgi:hypothetical protein